MRTRGLLTSLVLASCGEPSAVVDDAATEQDAGGDAAQPVVPSGRYFDVVFAPPTAVEVVQSPDPNPINPSKQLMVRLTGGDIVLSRDVVYGSWPYRLAGGASVDLTLDVYEPDQALDSEPARAVIVAVHGGGFVGGDKAENKFADYCASFFAPRGWVCVAVNYRLGSPDDDDAARPGIQQAALADVQAALRYLRRSATTWRIDPERIAIIGSSAGAILSADAAVAGEFAATPGAITNHDSDPDLDTSSRVAMAIALSGMYSELVGPPTYDAADAPVMFLHGDCDRTVPFSGAVATHDGLIAAGVPSWLVEYDGFGHCLGGTTQADNQDRMLPVLWQCVIGGGCPASTYALVDTLAVPGACEVTTQTASCHAGPSYP